MVRYAFDLYPRTDPRDGTVIRRFEHLQEASYRAEENGTGSGQIKVAGDSPDGEDIDPRGLQYIRVVEIDDSDVETVKGGFWLEQGQYQALTRRETKHLEFGGAGTLAYLQRAVMWSRTYIHDVFTGQDPIGTTWNLAGQSTYYANGNHLGAMLWRAIYEAQHFQSGAYTHRHFDFEETGITHTGTHDDDRTESAIPDLVMTFDQNEDSDGNPWTLTAGTFTAQVGESVLSVTRRLMELGLKVEMDPDTFELHAWEAPHRTDRTSTSWASGKVLFTAPTAQDIATGNILSDTIRTIRAFIKRSIVLAGSDNVYAISEGATDIPWEGGYRFDVDDAGTAEDVASRQRLARADSVDNVKVVMKLGNAPLEGRYRPWVHVNPGDLVTLDTGTDQWEFDNTTFPVAALTVELKQGGDWRAIAELGSSFTSLLEPAFQVGGAPAHTHPPNPQLCQVPQPSTESTTRLYFSNGVHAHNVAGDAAWDNLQSGTARTLKTTRDETYLGSHSLADSQGGADRDIQKWIGLYGPLSSAEAAIVAAGGSTISGQLRARMRFGIGITESIQSGFTLIGVRVTQGASTTIRGTAAAVGSPGSTEITGQSTRHNRQIGPATLSAVGGTVAGDFLVVEVGYRNDTPGGETSGSSFALTCDDALDDLPSGNDNTGAVLNSYLDWVTITGSGTSGDLPLDTVHQGFEQVGSASRAARCDHQHAHGLLSEDGTEYHDFGVIDLSDDTPLEESGSGSAGTAEEASRADHVHPADSGGGGGSASNITGAYDIEGDGSPTYSDAGMSDEFDSGTLDAQWTAVGGSAGTLSLTTANPADSVYDLSSRPGSLGVQIDISDSIAFRQDAVPAAGQSIVASIWVPSPFDEVNVGNSMWVGIGLNDNDTDYDSGNHCELFWDGADDNRILSQTSGAAAIIGEWKTAGAGGRRMYFRLTRVSNTIHFFASHDGIGWVPLGTEAIGTYNNFWVFFDTKGVAVDGSCIGWVNWVRHVASTAHDLW